MIIKICDRCGKKIEPDVRFTRQMMIPRYQIKLDGGLGYDYAGDNEVTEIHLCDDCNRVLRRWLAGDMEEFRAKMKTLAESNEPESFHSYADELMCETLTELGYEEGVKIFEDEEKWYS